MTRQTLSGQWLTGIFSSMLFLLVSLPARGDDAPDPLNSFLTGLDTLESGFTQTLIGTKGNVLEEAAGVLRMQNPGKFYWGYQSPYVQSIITNGKTLWIYDEDLEQVTIRDVSATINTTPAAILSGSEDLHAHYIVKNLGVIEGINMYELQPRNSENQFHSIHIGFHGDKLFLMVMYDNLGQITRVNFKNPVRNVAVDAGSFEFAVPNNVDIIDDRQTNPAP